VTPEAVISFEDVAVRIEGRDVLRSVSLSVAPGEIVALAGRNGAGKTTLFRVASRVLHHERGRVWVEGKPIESLTRRALAGLIAVVPQDISVPFPFRAGEIVLMGRAPHLGTFGFESAEDVERARAAMAQMDMPRLLLLDEPTAHLDLRHRTAVLERVQAFVRGGRSALIVSHDLSLAARTCDRLALLAGGSVIACGPPADVLTPENLRAAFDIEAEVLHGPDGAPLVIPRTAGRRARNGGTLR
jgi:iron complex transport system ATP-binding protein